MVMTGGYVLFGFAGVTFAAPRMLWLLALVPLAGGLLLWLTLWRRGAARRLVGRAVTPRASGTARTIKAALLLAGLTLLVIAAARPRIGVRPVLLPREGTDVILALDVSASMLATDLQPNRFEHAKLLVNQVFDGLQGDRVGLVAFAGNAVLRFPLTTDIEAARELVKSTAIREGNLRPGTGIGDALKVAGTAFGDDSARSRLIVLISDGEDLAGEALESVRIPRDRGVLVYAVGIGTDTGSTLSVPDPRTGRVQPRLDPQTGQPAVSRANESLMRSIAAAGRGKFYNGNGDDGVAPLNQEIAALERTRFASQEGSLPIERYQWFLAAGIALLIIEMLIPERRRRSGGAAQAERRKEGRRAA